MPKQVIQRDELLRELRSTFGVNLLQVEVDEKRSNDDTHVCTISVQRFFKITFCEDPNSGFGFLEEIKITSQLREFLTTYGLTLKKE